MRKYVFLIYVLLSLVGCAVLNNNSDIVGTWNFVQIIDETDGEVGNLGKGNYIKISDDHFLVMWKEIGNRYHEYERDGKVFSVGGEPDPMTWTMILQKENELQFLTPIGIFVLKR